MRFVLCNVAVITVEMPCSVGQSVKNNCKVFDKCKNLTPFLLSTLVKATPRIMSTSIDLLLDLTLSKSGRFHLWHRWVGESHTFSFINPGQRATPWVMSTSNPLISYWTQPHQSWRGFIFHIVAGRISQLSLINTGQSNTLDYVNIHWLATVSNPIKVREVSSLTLWLRESHTFSLINTGQSNTLDYVNIHWLTTGMTMDPTPSISGRFHLWHCDWEKNILFLKLMIYGLINLVICPMSPFIVIVQGKVAVQNFWCNFSKEVLVCKTYFLFGRHPNCFIQVHKF
jgi:hypothetical protein